MLAARVPLTVAALFDIVDNVASQDDLECFVDAFLFLFASHGR
jgi:hypothetical protein